MSERFNRAGYLEGGSGDTIKVPEVPKVTVSQKDVKVDVQSGFAGDSNFVKGKRREERREATLAEARRVSAENARLARERISKNAGNRSNETGKSVSEQLDEARASKARQLSQQEQDDIQDFFQASNEYEDSVSEKSTEAILKGGLDIELGKGALTRDEERSRRIELTNDEKIAIMSAKIDAMDENNVLADKQVDKSVKSPDSGFRMAMSAQDSQVLYDNLTTEDDEDSVIPSNKRFDEQMQTAESVKAQKYADKLEKKAQRKGFFGKLLNKLFR